jgi:DNA mismatch repair protein MutS
VSTAVRDCSWRRRALDAELARLAAAEIVSPDAFRGMAGAGAPRGLRQHRGRAPAEGAFGVATLDGFGSFDRPALAAAGGLLAYLDEVARESLPSCARRSAARRTRT